MREYRTILHLDLDAFFCAVEEQRDKSLRGKAFAVGGRPDQRGVVSTCSYAARQKGGRSAMPMSRALRLCPELIIVPGHYSLYERASRAVMTRLHAITPLVEQVSIDEAFLDITASPEPPLELATRLHTQILEELRLPNSVGIATNKLVAKIATEFGKSQNRGSGPPNAITQVLPGEEAAFLAPLPVRMLWGVGPQTEKRLAEDFQVTTIGELAKIPSLTLAQRYGKHGQWLAQAALGQDDSPVITHHETKSISQETTFNYDQSSSAVLEATLREQAAWVSQSLKDQGMKAHTVKIKLRWSDFTTLTRQVTFAIPTDDAGEIARLAILLLHRTWQPPRRVRLIGVGTSSLVKETPQLSLFELSHPENTP